MLISGGGQSVAPKQTMIGWFGGCDCTYKNWNIWSNINYCTKYTETAFNARLTTPGLLMFHKDVTVKCYYSLFTPNPISGDNNGACKLFKNTEILYRMDNTNNIQVTNGVLDISFSAGDIMKVMIGGAGYTVICALIAS